MGNREALMQMAQAMVAASGGRLRLAHNEENGSTDFQREAAHFLKLDEQRVGRDIELYGFMGGTAGWEMTLAEVLEEVLLPVRGSGLEEAYAAGAEKLKEIGKSVYDDELYPQFVALFD